MHCGSYLLLTQKKLSDFFRESTLADFELDLAREASPVRNELLVTRNEADFEDTGLNVINPWK